MHQPRAGVIVEPDKAKAVQYLRWAKALLLSMDASVRAADQGGLWRHASYKQFARKYNELVTSASQEFSLPPFVDFLDLEKIPSAGDTVVFQQKEIFDVVYANLSLFRAFLEDQAGVIEDETQALRDFFQSRLRSAVHSEPSKETEVQDVVEVLLIGRGMQKGSEFDREVGRVKHSAKESVPDFIIPNLSMAIEVKLIKTASRVSIVVDEINADIAAYSKKYRSLLFIVYDTGHIRDEVEFKQDLDNGDNVFIIIVKH